MSVIFEQFACVTCTVEFDRKPDEDGEGILLDGDEPGPGSTSFSLFILTSMYLSTTSGNAFYELSKTINENTMLSL